MINKDQAFIFFGIVIGMAITTIIFLPIYSSVNSTIYELKEINTSLENDIAEKTRHSLLANPDSYFELLKDQPSWLPSNDIPYSFCYKHLVDAETSNYIICKAI